MHFQMSRLGYESNNPILNLGSLALVLAILFLNILFTFLVLKPIGHWNPHVKYYIKKNFYRILTGNIFLVFMEAYMEFLISSWLFF